MSTDQEPDKHLDQEEPSEATNDPAEPASEEMASFWDESQVRKVIRHAGRTGRSPEEFFNKKWKDKFIHKKPDNESPADDAK